jgi:transposase
MRERRHPNVVAVALANKNARIVWSLLSTNQKYRRGHTDHEKPSQGGLKGILQHLPGDGEGSRPLFLEPDVWIGTVSTNALGAMREKQAEIHRGSRR